MDKSPGDSLLFKQSALRGVSYALTILPLLDGELAGLSNNAAAGELNSRGVKAARGGRWTARSVLNLKARMP